MQMLKEYSFIYSKKNESSRSYKLQEYGCIETEEGLECGNTPYPDCPAPEKSEIFLRGSLSDQKSETAPISNDQLVRIEFGVTLVAVLLGCFILVYIYDKLIKLNDKTK